MFEGAKWWKVDFHVHSPASMDYKDNEISPREWLLQVMNKDIDCIVLTDHNTGSWIDKVKNEIELMKNENYPGYRDIYIFPGVEISVNGGIHLLAVFDFDMGSEDITSLLGSIEYAGTKGDSNGVTRKSFEEVVEKIHDFGGIAIPAHVDSHKGLFKEMHGTTLKQILTSCNLLAIEIVAKDYSKPQVYEDSKLKLTEVAGSDAHNVCDIGKRYSLIKMAIPNLNALWLALHDSADGVIRYDEVNEKINCIDGRLFLKSVKIENGYIIGRNKKVPFEVKFSPWLTSIIGGRGTGKSSVLNFIRLVLQGKNTLPSMLEQEFNDFIEIRKDKNGKGMLKDDTVITLEFLKDNSLFKIVWRNFEVEEYIFDEDKKWISKGTCHSINERYPVRIYSQKELYETTKNPTVLFNLIDSQFEVEKYTIQLNILQEKWYDLRRKNRKLKSQLNGKRLAKTKLEDINLKLKMYESTQYKNILQNYQIAYNGNQKIKELIDTASGNCANYEINIFDTLEMNTLLIENLSDNDKHTLENALIALNNQSMLMRQHLFEYQTLVSKLNEICSTLEWNAFVHTSTKAYETLKEKTDILPSDKNAYNKLVEEKAKIELELNDVSLLESEIQKNKEEQFEIYQQIIDINKEINHERNKVIEKWNTQNSNIKVILEKMGDMAGSELVFRSIIRKVDSTFKRDILDYDDNEEATGIIYKLCSESDQNIDKWMNREKIIKEICRGEGTYSKSFKKHIKKLSEETPEDIDKLLIFIPNDKIVLKLIDNGREESIENGSAGQRTAAILSLILTLNDKMLIIDQPEDDLDTKRITDLVVSGIRNFKLKQQVIVVTHNPNIPVNGAAEQIVCMNHVRGGLFIQTQGALQENTIRKAICEIMEGGEQALDNRYYRISKAMKKYSSD